MRSSRTDFHAKGEALQELDHVSIMKPITKFAATVPHTQRIPEIISMAFRAMGGYGELVTQPQDIRPAMERARASSKPSCVNVILDPDIYSSGTMNQTMYK